MFSWIFSFSQTLPFLFRGTHTHSRDINYDRVYTNHQDMMIAR